MIPPLVYAHLIKYLTEYAARQIAARLGLQVTPPARTPTEPVQNRTESAPVVRIPDDAFEIPSFDPVKETLSEEERLNRLVFIGRNLDKEKITQGFLNCITTGNGASSSEEVDPFGRKQDVSNFTLDQIRYWVQTILTFPPDAPIVVKEVPCVKAGCPPVETAIMVFLKNEPPRTFKILARINEVTFDHVYNLIENPLPCC